MYPDFLGIGAQKAGTTWLHTNLARHPQIWMPPIKEMHYLDHRPPHLVERLFGRKQFLKSGRALLRRRLVEAARGGSREDLAWAARYCLGRRSDDWYCALFPKIDGKITGEVCPGYARLDGDQVARVYAMMPKTKIIYLIRNPIERAWSGLAMHFRKDGVGSIEEVAETEIEARLRHPKSWRHGEYAKNLAAWESCYPAEQISVGFFDELLENPRGQLKEILGFLGVDNADDRIPADVGDRRNTGRGEVVPPRFEGVLARVFVEEVRSLNARFDNQHTRRWLSYTEERL